jgi:hypothetical protein
VGESLVDDAWTATPLRGAAESRATSLPLADTKMACSPRTVEAGEGATVGDVGAAVSSRVIDVDPISAIPARGDDLVKDQPQIDHVPGGLGTSRAEDHVWFEDRWMVASLCDE